jgi:hypothetical protein
MYSSEPLPHFVDDYVAYLHEAHPTVATFDGVHTHDDLLEDFSRAGIDTHMRDLGNFGRRLDAINPESLTAVQRAEKPMLEANIRGRLFELEDLRSWERNPLLYAETLAMSLAAQALFPYAPAEERARRVLSKLRQAPGLLQSARANIKEPPGIFIKTALETLRGVATFIDRDLPRAFVQVDDPSLLSDFLDAMAEAKTAVESYAGHLETEVAPKTKGSFRIGRDKFEKKLKLEEGLALSADQILAIAMRELHATQEEFRKAAARVEKGDPVEVWRRVKAHHPEPGTVAATARSQVEELATFLQRQALVTIPPGDGPIIGPTPQFFRWTFASVWTPGAFESRPLKTYFYVTDVEPSWSDERKEEHLRDFSHAALWSIAAHEAYPGHVLHFQHIRQVESKLRKSILFAPLSFVEGWAHYGEQLVIEQGFARDDATRRLGQLAEALIRLVRVIVGVRLHAEDLSVEQGVRFFRDEAFIEESSARREAERGTFDPSYVVYTLGKLMLLKLRDDVRARDGDRFSLKEFHDTLLGQGFAPFAVHRALMLGDKQGGALLD